MERRKFTREFKLEAVRLIKERGVSYAQASRDLSIREFGSKNSARQPNIVGTRGTTPSRYAVSTRRGRVKPSPWYCLRC